MSVFTVTCKIPGIGKRDFIVDTGATYSSIPRSLLDKIGIVPISKRRFSVADGRVLEADFGQCPLEIVGTDETLSVFVLFGEERSPLLLGATALEGFGLTADPVKHKLVPSHVIMAGGIEGKATL